MRYTNSLTPSPTAATSAPITVTRQSIQVNYSVLHFLSLVRHCTHASNTNVDCSVVEERTNRQATPSSAHTILETVRQYLEPLPAKRDGVITPAFLLPRASGNSRRPSPNSDRFPSNQRSLDSAQNCKATQGYTRNFDYFHPNCPAHGL